MRKIMMNGAGMCFLVAFLSLVPLSQSFLRADSTARTFLDDAVLERISREVSGAICYDHIQKISTFDRIWGSQDYHLAAQYLIDKAKEYGLEQTVIERYSIRTGRELFWMHGAGGVPPWNLRRAEIRLIKPYDQLISHSDSVPSAVASGSRSTKTEAEIIFVGRGDSENCYAGKNPAGKIVLAEGGSPKDVHEIAVHRHSALGTMVYSVRPEKYWDSEAVFWSRISPWSDDGKRESTFGVNLSTRQGLFLRDLLERGEKVVVSVKIEAEVDPNGAFELATAVIPGSLKPEEEFIFYAHLDHPKPGAHDNGSGDGVLLEIARTLSSLIGNNIIPPPKRTIRFMWVPHMMGVNMYFFHHQDKIGKVKGGCNVDCVGVDPAKFPSMFHLSLPPYSLPTPLMDVTQSLADRLNREIASGHNMLYEPDGSRNQFSVTIRPYMGYSDEYTANTRSLNMPSILFDDTPIPPRHSQVNFLEYLDRTQLKRISYLGAVISYAFASIGQDVAPFIIDEIRFRGKIRLEREFLLAKTVLNNSLPNTIHKDYDRGRNLLAWGFKRETGIMDSLSELIADGKTENNLCSEFKRLLEDEAKVFPNQLKKAYEERCRELHTPVLRDPVQRRHSPMAREVPILNPKIKGSPGYFGGYFEGEIGEDFLKKYPGVRSRFNYGNVGYYETLNYIDGKNTISDIYEAVEAELWSGGYDEDQHLTFEETVEYIRMLKEAHVVDIPGA